MGTTAFSGPVWSTGSMDYLRASFGAAVPDYNADAGPCGFYQGVAIPDPRFILQKNKLNGFAGVQPAYLQSAGIETCDAVPAAYGAAKIAAAQHVATSNAALTLVSTNAAGITCNVPISPYNGAINGNSIVTAAIVLDFGFAFGTVTSGSTNITVADSSQFTIGMPLVIPGAVSGGGALLTWVTAKPSGTVVTVNDTPTASGTLAIGTGDIWPGAPLSTASQAYPFGHLPYIGGGPGLFFDPTQAIARGVSVTCNNAAGVGGTITVKGYDIYWQPMTENIVITPASALVSYGKKAFKAITQVLTRFTDATYTYSVGTSDVFGYNLRARNWERTSGSWAAGFLTGSNGFTAFTTPASGDVRGTLQVSAIGGGTGYGATASNGAVSSLVMTGNRLVTYQSFSVADTLNANPNVNNTLFGSVQT